MSAVTPKNFQQRMADDVVPMPRLRVLVFLADSNRPSQSAGGYVQRHSGQSLLPLFCQSVARFHEDVRFTILTTPTTKLPVLPYPTEIFARPVGDGPLLYERMRHYLTFLEEAPAENTYLFLESDMLMLQRLRLDVGEDWDVALAYKSTGMWINSGMFLVRAGRREQAIEFLRHALAIYRKRHLNHPKWGADQAALRDALGLTEPPQRPCVQATEGARVLLVPRHEFTRFAPWYAWVAPPRTWILHFSGGRKKAMPYFHWLHMGKGSGIGRAMAWLRREDGCLGPCVTNMAGVQIDRRA